MEKHYSTRMEGFFALYKGCGPEVCVGGWVCMRVWVWVGVYERERQRQTETDRQRQRQRQRARARARARARERERERRDVVLRCDRESVCV